MSDQIVFAERLVAERVRLGLKVKEMASLCGVKVATQYLYERGERSPNSDYIQKAFEAGVKPENLFDFKHLSYPKRKNENIDWEASLNSAFLETEIECRDPQGRLLDPYFRLQKIREKLFCRAS
ncbi:helix-turn-helix domain-containing protein [Reinekea sp. G2M2-21]|uniref:helix-turn-helix domain-containing protein n=1 Tax=Reinekea sp. G2M2-21 TaxID=2788942 RepID=UPI0018AB8FD5|nr:helix-turn-helix transcriptional regulator [Reinekea sp. G2M2-21]